jgi:zinc/manganese transport system substrate-binding protein
MAKALMMWLVLALAVCSAGSAHAAPMPVVATLPGLGRVAEAVGGDRVAVATIASGVQDPHFVDPRPSYMVKLRDAEALLVNGLDLEVGWVPPLIQGSRNGKLRPGAAGYIDCSRNIPVIEVPTRQITRAEGDVHPFGNPHYMTDPLNAKIVAETVAQAFTRLRPGDAEYFAARLKAFQSGIDKAMFGAGLVELVGGKKLDRLARSGELEAFLASAPGATLGGWLGELWPLRGRKLVFYHRSYSYFAQRFGLSVVDYVELKPGIQPGPSHLADVVTMIGREQVGLVVAHPFNDGKIARLVADKGGASLVTVPLDVSDGDLYGFYGSVCSALAGAMGAK